MYGTLLIGTTTDGFSMVNLLIQVYPINQKYLSDYIRYGWSPDVVKIGSYIDIINLSVGVVSTQNVSRALSYSRHEESLAFATFQLC